VHQLESLKSLPSGSFVAALHCVAIYHLTLISAIVCEHVCKRFSTVEQAGESPHDCDAPDSEESPQLVELPTVDLSTAVSSSSANIISRSSSSERGGGASA
jgi:hypothetical protein